MPTPVIRVENLSKQYRLGQVGTGTISHDLNRWWHRIRGKEDPYLKIGETNDRASKAESEYVWALKDINFEVKQGEVLGIIGKNGAGKSTLLKLLSKVTGPTTGLIQAKGRIASLLEVGTGFHPELTGRENIYLNGAILGMTKREVNRKLDEIVDFAGVARYLDTPVKRYSSGMTVRLGFAVAAHLEPEILVVDEVLAVGDAEFQKKAIGKMQDVSKNEGRTVLFVSHNMASIKTLCRNGIVLSNGNISFSGTASAAVDRYLMSDENILQGEEIPENYPDRYNLGYAFYRKIKLVDQEGKAKERFYYRQPIVVVSELEVLELIKDAILFISLTNAEGLHVLHKDNTLENPDGIQLSKGKYQIGMYIDLHLLPGDYHVELSISHSDGKTVDNLANLYRFTVEKTSLKKGEEYRWDKARGFVTNTNQIQIENI